MATEIARLEREHAEALQSLEHERTERQRVEAELKKITHSIQPQKEVCQVVKKGQNTMYSLSTFLVKKLTTIWAMSLS
jgi:iron-sulfur cluster repair protein YtfE (RIC family)